MPKIFIFLSLLCLTLVSNCYAVKEWSYCSQRMNVVGLVEPYAVKSIKENLKGRRTLYYYINATRQPLVYHTDKKKYVVPSSDLREINPTTIQFIADTFTRLSKIIDLRFERVNTSDQADFTINSICHVNSSLCGDDILDTKKNRQTVFINICALDKPSNAMITSIFLHEVGHVLGLEHPFDDYDYDCIYNTKPFEKKSANKLETQMAYKFLNKKPIPIWYSKHDIKALISIWGAAKK